MTKMNNVTRLHQVIARLEATEEEREALSEILHVEGFGGREDRARDAVSARRIAADRLDWLRDMRAEGLR